MARCDLIDRVTTTDIPGPADAPPAPPPGLLTYPPADRDELVEVLHGVEVADPYRYLEDPDAPRTKEFVAAQNALSEPYLTGLPGRDRFAELTTALVTAPRSGVPVGTGRPLLRGVQPG